MNTRISFSRTQAVFTFLFLFLFCAATSNAAAVFDPSFGTNGTASIGFTPDAPLGDIGVQADGKIVISATVRGAGTNKDIVFARFLPNGSRDTSFGTNGILILPLSNADDIINDFEIQADGKIVAVGQQQVAPDVAIYDFLAIRINANGTLDTSFGTDGKVIINQGQPDNFTKVDVQPDGKIVAVGGTFEEERFAFMVRLNSNGSLDSTFGVGGITSYNLGFPPTIRSFPTDIEVLPDGKILLGGALMLDRPGINDDEVGFYEIRLLSDGSLDNSFGSQGVLNTTNFLTHGYAATTYDAAVLPNGKIVKVGGNGVFVDNTRFSQDGLLTAVLPDGKFVVSGGKFGGNLKTYSQNNLIGTAWNIPPGKIVAQSDGKILVLLGSTITRVKLLTSQGTRLANFNKDELNQSSPADDKTDFAVYRPGEKRMYVLKSDGQNFQRTTAVTVTKVFPEFSFFALNTNIYREVLSSWGGSSLNQPAFFNFDRTSNETNFRFQWGLGGDIPFGGDFDGNGTFDVGVFRPSNGVWYGYANQIVNQQGVFAQWGTSGDKPVPADYDFDGKTDYAVYRPSNGTWWVLRSSDGGLTGVQFGAATDIPVTGDFDGDGKADFTVYRPSEGNWYQLLTTEGFKTTPFGLADDYPVAGDYDGDGRHDIALFRSGVWYILQSRDGLKIIQWGTNGDIPVAVRYDQ